MTAGPRAGATSLRQWQALCSTLEQSAEGAAASRPSCAQSAARATGQRPTFLEPEGILTRVRPVSGLCDTTIA